MILAVQFALSTDDPYPSSNWIIVLHTVDLSVRETRSSASFNLRKYSRWFVVPLLRIYCYCFILGDCYGFLKEKMGKRSDSSGTNGGDRYLNRKILSGKMIDKRSEEKRRTLSFVFDKEIFLRNYCIYARVTHLIYDIYCKSGNRRRV